MNTLRILLAGCLTGGALYAQDQDGRLEVDSSHHVDQFVPAILAEEGGLRFPARVPIDADAFVPEAGPRMSGQHFGRLEAVVYDVETGNEKYFVLPEGNFAPRGRVSGRALLERVAEPGIDSFGSLTSVSSSSFPWSTHCRMFYTKGGSSRAASGTLIDARHVITAGHVVHQGGGGSWSSAFTVSPAWDGDDDAYGSAGATKLMSFTGWTVSGSLDHDMGFVRLDRPVGFLTGWLGYFYNNSNSWWRSNSFHGAGYPGSCFSGAPDQLYYHYGTWDSVNSNQVSTNKSESCPTGGMSGMGIYDIDGSDRYVGAAHSWRRGSTTEMGACRMTSGKFSSAQSFVGNGYTSSDVDYIPLKVRVGNNSITAGNQLSSMSYVVGNTSLYNPGSRTIDVDVYLSTNDNISTADTLIQSHRFTYNFDAKDDVTVNVGSPPTIPAGTSAGNYWVGVIIDESDDDTSNNDSDGWDADPLTVN